MPLPGSAQSLNFLSLPIQRPHHPLCPAPQWCGLPVCLTTRPVLWESLLLHLLEAFQVVAPVPSHGSSHGQPASPMPSLSAISMLPPGRQLQECADRPQLAERFCYPAPQCSLWVFTECLGERQLGEHRLGSLSWCAGMPGGSHHIPVPNGEG